MKVAFFIIVALAAASLVSAQDGLFCKTIDFEVDGFGNPLIKDSRIKPGAQPFWVPVSSGSSVLTPGSFSISAQVRGLTGALVDHELSIFDSSNPWSHDADLGSPNYLSAAGGPGLNDTQSDFAPLTNTQPLGNILVIQQSLSQSKANDRSSGGVMKFAFAYPVIIDHVTVIDVEKLESGGDVEARVLGGAVVKRFFSDVVDSEGTPIVGDNVVTKVPMNIDGVTELDVLLKGSGGLAEIRFCYSDCEGPPGSCDIIDPCLNGPCPCEATDEIVVLPTECFDVADPQTASGHIRVSAHTESKCLCVDFAEGIQALEDCCEDCGELLEAPIEDPNP